jgi:1-deoxy-D-xylulose-5-phosphate synthase
LLDRIDGPDDLKQLKVEQLLQLAGELRKRIIAVIYRNGGHLGGPLGAVELTLALHYILDSPRDRIVWDVGHQAYAHKILTGRRDAFETIRRYGGLSGYPRRTESPHDTFGTAHACTSISAALGMAAARDLSHTDQKVIAVIGDGGMTGGLAYEAINNAGDQGRNLLVILNDNRMSISPNVGAITRYLTDVISNETYNRLKTEIWEITGRLSGLGDRVREVVTRLEESLKGLLVPGMLFENLGFRYFGPEDGHDLPRLINLLRHLKTLPGPLLLHLYTVKGKGFEKAEADQQKYHAVSAAPPAPPADKVEGMKVQKPKAASKKFSDAFGEALVRLAADRPKVVAITAAMSDGTGLNHFAKAYPDRFFDVGIAEQHGVCFAAGLAAAGHKPVAAIYSTFLQRAYDQVIHDIAIQSLPVVFVLDRAGLVGDDGATHHGVFDIGYLRVLPGMVVGAPRDDAELAVMLELALDWQKGPFALRIPRGNAKAGTPRPSSERLGVGEAEVLHEGNDVALLAYGAMVEPVLEAAEHLETEGLSAAVVDMRFVKPLDARLLAALARTVPYIVTVEDAQLACGVGSAVLEHYEQCGVRGPRIRRLGIPDTFIDHGSRDRLLADVGLNPEGIARQALAFVRGDGARSA